jgi:hypothetical protein
MMWIHTETCGQFCEAWCNVIWIVHESILIIHVIVTKLSQTALKITFSVFLWFWEQVDVWILTICTQRCCWWGCGKAWRNGRLVEIQSWRRVRFDYAYCFHELDRATCGGVLFFRYNKSRLHKFIKIIIYDIKGNTFQPLRWSSSGRRTSCNGRTADAISIRPYKPWNHCMYIWLPV